MDFNPAHNVSLHRIRTAKYITTTFAYRSTSFLFNECMWSFRWHHDVNLYFNNDPDYQQILESLKIKMKERRVKIWNLLSKSFRCCWDFDLKKACFVEAVLNVFRSRIYCTFSNYKDPSQASRLKNILHTVEQRLNSNKQNLQFKTSCF